MERLQKNTSRIRQVTDSRIQKTKTTDKHKEERSDMDLTALSCVPGMAHISEVEKYL